ncbi:hypothetical protein I4U23_028840 [Adineta vaga]|nr:hypothetical protein I4U23_028840 [Adineta vaga]
MSNNYRFIPIDIIIFNSFTVLSWISTSAILYWTSTLYQSMELNELGFMLMSDRIKYLLYRRAHRNMQIDRRHPFQQGLLFFSRPDFSNELYGHHDLLRSQSTC